ncbi:MAG: DUF2784 domain-containing protein, partial [Frankia sp.]
IAVGGLGVWRWPRLLCVHLLALIYGILIIEIGFICPLTPLEKDLRRAGGEQVYQGGFIDHYIKGELYPRGLNPVVQGLILLVTVVGYTGLRQRRRSQARLAVSPGDLTPRS